MSKIPIFHKIKRSLEKKFGQEEDGPVSPDEKLFELINLRPWDESERKKFDEAALYAYVKQNPNSVKTQYEFRYNRKISKNYPLSRMIALGSSLATIKKVHKLFPPAMKHLPQSRNTTLHVACIYSAPCLELIQYVLDKNPDAIRQPNEHVFLPLHHACQATIPAPASLPLIQLLVKAYPEALQKTNKLGDTPLATARRNGASSPEVIDYLLQQEDHKRVVVENR